MDLMDRSWTCYPHGLLPTRRAFLTSMAAAAAAAGVPLPVWGAGQDGSPGDEPIPAFPPGGYPADAVQLNFNENPLGPPKKVLAALGT